MIVVPLFLGPRSPWPASVTACLAPDDGQRLAGGARGPRAFNIFWDRLSGLTVTDNPAALDTLAGESGIAMLIALTAVAAWIGLRLPARIARGAKA